MEDTARRVKTKPLFGKNAFIAENAITIGAIKAGDDVSIWYNVVVRADVADIKIGNRTNIQDGSVLHVSHDHDLIIGDDVTVGHGVMLHGCTIGNNVLVGTGSIVLDGATIGDNCIIAAGALIPPRKKFPANSFIMGNPAEIKREMRPEDIERVFNNAERYLLYKEIYTFEGYNCVNKTTK